MKMVRSVGLLKKTFLWSCLCYPVKACNHKHLQGLVALSSPVQTLVFLLHPSPNNPTSSSRTSSLPRLHVAPVPGLAADMGGCSLWGGCVKGSTKTCLKSLWMFPMESTDFCWQALLAWASCSFTTTTVFLRGNGDLYGPSWKFSFLP